MCSAVLFPITIALMVGTATPASPYRPAPVEWPVACAGKSYCHVQPSYYPNTTIENLMAKVEMRLLFNQKDDPENRDSEDDDVAGCKGNPALLQIFLIKDNMGQIRYVTQTKKFTIKIVIEECSYPGRVTRAYELENAALELHRVECLEKRVPFMLPVLSLDGTKLDSVVPAGGLSLSCSAKVMK